jgi:hypothetical protein
MGAIEVLQGVQEAKDGQNVLYTIGSLKDVSREGQKGVDLEDKDDGNIRGLCGRIVSVK